MAVLDHSNHNVTMSNTTPMNSLLEFTVFNDQTKICVKTKVSYIAKANELSSMLRSTKISFRTSTISIPSARNLEYRLPINVGAATLSDDVWPGTQGGPQFTICAPGEGVSRSKSKITALRA
jgi:hypothetical protein